LRNIFISKFNKNSHPENWNNDTISLGREIKYGKSRQRQEQSRCAKDKSTNLDRLVCSTIVQHGSIGWYKGEG
jgi:hypothetical protein